VASFGFAVATPFFDCIDWAENGADLSAAGLSFDVHVSPYSLGCAPTRAALVAVSSIAALEEAELDGKIVLLHGEIAKEQLMPKDFPFYNPDEHQHIIHVLESKRPCAIVAATSRDPNMVGSGVYPFPLFEDGDFEVPSVYTTDVEGERLAQLDGQEVQIEIRAQRIPATGCNVVATKGARSDRRVVIFAHIDARLGTPGAGDNASGTIVLLLLAELLAEYAGDLGVELVAMNGEDYFSSPGEKQWLAQNAGRSDEILLGINVDDVGFIRGKVAYSLYGCPPGLEGMIRNTLASHPGLIEGPPWYQGDHGLYLMNQIPALALTSELLEELMAGYTHTPDDTPAVVDTAKLVAVAHALCDVLLMLDEHREAQRR
jgi:aminopeptidase YwaD